MSILNKPDPFESKFKNQLIYAACFSIFIFFFLFVFQPFGIARIPLNKLEIILGFALITFFTIFTFFIVAGKILDQEKWTTNNEIAFFLLITFSIGTLNWVYAKIIAKETLIIDQTLFQTLFNTLIIGIIPVPTMVMIRERRLNKKNNILGKYLSKALVKKYALNVKKAEIGPLKNMISVDLNKIKYLKSSGNYVELFTEDDSRIKKILLRISLKKIQEQLKNYSEFKSCHRSYVVNSNHIFQILGNARNFRLQIEDLNFKIPVSRDYPIEDLNKN